MGCSGSTAAARTAKPACADRFSSSISPCSGAARATDVPPLSRHQLAEVHAVDHADDADDGTRLVGPPRRTTWPAGLRPASSTHRADHDDDGGCRRVGVVGTTGHERDLHRAEVVAPAPGGRAAPQAGHVIECGGADHPIERHVDVRPAAQLDSAWALVQAVGGIREARRQRHLRRRTLSAKATLPCRRAKLLMSSPAPTNAERQQYASPHVARSGWCSSAEPAPYLLQQRWYCHITVIAGPRPKTSRSPARAPSWPQYAG